MHALDELRTLLDHYTEMLALAEANDWEALAAVTAETVQLRDALQRAGALADFATPEDVPALRETLEAILALNRRICEHTVPNLESTRRLLSGAVRNRTVRAAYSAGDS